MEQRRRSVLWGSIVHTLKGRAAHVLVYPHGIPSSITGREQTRKEKESQRWDEPRATDISGRSGRSQSGASQTTKL